MKLLDTYQGGNDPFEGDRAVTLRALPAGARIRRAIITVAPAQPAAGNQFEEEISFIGTGRTWGATRNPASGLFAEVDFHARRTVVQVAGSGLTGTNLQVDMGGAYVEINDRGAIRTPDDTRFALLADGTLPGLTVSKFRLSRLAGTNLTLNSVTIRSVPTNVSVRLGQMPAFWTRLGELSLPESSPDFAAVLTAFLATAPVADGLYSLPFVLHSDTIARLDVTVEIDYFMEQPVLPPHLPEVTLPYNFSTQPGSPVDLLTVGLPRQALPIAGLTGAQIRGEFQPTRIAEGPIGQERASFPVVVSPACSLAQPLRSAMEIEVVGIDLPLANTTPGLAGMNISIQADADGKPSGETLTLAAVRVEKPLPGQSTWGSATLPTPFRVLPGVSYWLVLQSLIGEAYWRAVVDVAAAPALQCSRDAGLSWRVASTPGAVGPLSALFRLRHTPERFTVPVQLQIGSGPEAVLRRLDEFAPLGRIEFSFDFADRLGQYLAQPTLGSACGSGERLSNGGFDQPPHPDAARLLFGFDTGRSTVLRGWVDLSRGINLSQKRYLLLSIADQPAVRIDCAGADPYRTTLDEIVTAINRALRRRIASVVVNGGSARFLRLASTDSPPDEIKLWSWREAVVPQGWQRPPDSDGSISRLKVPTLFQGSEGERPELIVAALETAGTNPVILAQRVPVGQGCTYTLQLRYASFRSMDVLEAAFDQISDPDDSGLNELPPVAIRPHWQVRWLDSAAQVIRQDQADLTFIGGSQGSQTNTGMIEERLVAPAQASQAEIRLIQPSSGLLLLEDVSFASVLDAVTNGDFRRWERASDQGPGLPVGWTNTGGSVDGGPPVELRGDGLEETVLVQVVAVNAAEQYQLQVRAWPEPPPLADRATLPVQERARLELRWLADAPLDPPVLVPLDGLDFPTRAWTGIAPAQASQAEIRLIQPLDGGRLIVDSVALTRVEQVRVPLIFLAEAPGELTVSNLRVAYDLPPPPETTRRPQARPMVQPTSVGTTSRMSRRAPLVERSIGDLRGASERLVQPLRNAQPPITTVAELAAVDLADDIPNISRAELQELKTLAEMLLSIQVAVQPFAGLPDTPLEQLLTMSVSDLAFLADSSPAEAEQLQRSLRALRLLLKKTAFDALRLSELQGRGA